MHHHIKENRPADWTGVRSGRRVRPGEWVVEWGIRTVSFAAIAVIFLIFIFVGREAMPVILGKENSAAVRKVIPAADMDRLAPEQLREYLGLSQRQFAEMDREVLQLMMQVREEAYLHMPEWLRNDKDAQLNTVAWRYLLKPHQWTNHDEPAYIWQPISGIPKYNIVPLIIGSLKVTLVGLAFAVPLALGAAIYVSQLAPPLWRETIKPAIELLSSIPSVVMGAFALLVMATFLQNLFGYPIRLNAFVAGIALGLAVIPMVFSIAEDALTSVPNSYTQAAFALGATKWQAARQVVLPCALPGVFAAVVLGFGRAVGETMIVLMVCSAAVVSWSVFDPARALTATIAAEMAEAIAGGHHYRMLFLLGTLLFAVTFITNMIGDIIMHRYKRRLEGGRT